MAAKIVGIRRVTHSHLDVELVIAMLPEHFWAEQVPHSA